MLGAIIGDVAGSIYEVLEVSYLKDNHRPRPYNERIKILNKKTPLFTEKSSITDDTIMTCAIYDAIKNGNCDYDIYLRKYGLKELEYGLDKYGRNRFSKNYMNWLMGEYQGSSYGNGAATRVSPVGYLFDSYYEVVENSKLSSMPSHNNKEAIIAAEAVATSIYLIRVGFTKEKLKKHITNIYYNLDYNLEDLQKNNTFSSKSSESVPLALFVFLESNDFEDAIRKAISIGGDSDTIASIVGALSESYHGIPEEMVEKVKPYLRENMIDLLKEKYFDDSKILWKKYK